MGKCNPNYAASRKLPPVSSKQAQCYRTHYIMRFWGQRSKKNTPNCGKETSPLYKLRNI